MDIRRFAIIFGLAISTYFLILSWNDDYGQAAVGNAPIAQTDAVVVDDVPSASAVKPAAESTNSDVPQVEVAGEVKAEPVAQASTQNIVVNTDVLNVTISPLGGEVHRSIVYRLTRLTNDNKDMCLLFFWKTTLAVLMLRRVVC